MNEQAPQIALKREREKAVEMKIQLIIDRISKKMNCGGA
jgi:hypothetical protein